MPAEESYVLNARAEPHPCTAGVPDLADLVELGIFGPPHGIRGEIRLQAITDSLEERLSEPGAM